MPLLFLERFPWPSLQTYAALSTLLLAGTILSAYSTVRDPEYSSALTEHSHSASDEETQLDRTGSVATSVLLYLITDSLFVWVCAVDLKPTGLICDCVSFVKGLVMFPQVMVNTACCMLMLIAKVIQCIVFGPLRVSEKQV